MATPQMNYQINNTITNEELLSQQKFIEEMIRQRDIANDKILKHTIHRSESIDRPGSTNTIIENLHGIVEEISSSEIKDISEVKDILIPEVKDILIPEVKDIFIPEVKDIFIPEVKDILIPEVQDILIPEVKDILIPEIKILIPEVKGIFNQIQDIFTDIPYKISDNLLPTNKYEKLSTMDMVDENEKHLNILYPQSTNDIVDFNEDISLPTHTKITRKNITDENIPKERITILENISTDKNIFITIDFAVKIVDKI